MVAEDLVARTMLNTASEPRITLPLMVAAPADESEPVVTLPDADRLDATAAPAVRAPVERVADVSAPLVLTLAALTAPLSRTTAAVRSLAVSVADTDMLVAVTAPVLSELKASEAADTVPDAVRC